MIANNRGSHMKIMGEITSDDDAYESNTSGNESSDSNVWKNKKNKKHRGGSSKNLTDNRERPM
tara:strand:- start:1332 stop:1520 length:189 start_codon:yes stop_codon:yes gene_type:complete